MCSQAALAARRESVLMAEIHMCILPLRLQYKRVLEYLSRYGVR